MTERVPGEQVGSMFSTPQLSQQDDMLRLLVCPADHGQFRLEAQALACTVCGRTYPIEDGVPNMLLDDDV